MKPRRKPIPAARPDGRPLYYDLQVGFRVPCLHCASLLGLGHAHGRGEAYMNDPANSPVTGPDGLPDEAIYYLCKHHTPDNAVIFDPITGECHNKSGTEVWREDHFMPGPGEKV